MTLKAISAVHKLQLRNTDENVLAFLTKGQPTEILRRSLARKEARINPGAEIIIKVVSCKNAGSGREGWPDLRVIRVFEAKFNRVLPEAVSYTHLTLPTNREV